jgi:RNA-directed DNA polymerase
MIERILQPKILYKAYRQVVGNKGAAGVDGMQVDELKVFIDQFKATLLTDILSRKYAPQAIRGVEIPKSNGKTRLLGVPTVIDRWLQQAVSQQLATRFELEFEDESFGFRPQRNLHGAVLQALKHIYDGYQDIVDIDLKSFFDEVQHFKVLQLIYHRVKCPTTLWLIRKWLQAPIQINGKLHKRRKGMGRLSVVKLFSKSYIQYPSIPLRASNKEDEASRKASVKLFSFGPACRGDYQS